MHTKKKTISIKDKLLYNTHEEMLNSLLCNIENWEESKCLFVDKWKDKY